MNFSTNRFATSIILLGTVLIVVISVNREFPFHQRSLRAGDVNITQLLQNFSKEYPEYLNRKPDYFQTTAPAPFTGTQGLPLQSLPPTTRIPTTAVPAVVPTWAPTNRKVPLTSSPTTKNPISSAPSTIAPVTVSPTTKAPVTSRPTTGTPVTSALTPLAPVTSPPTTLNPITLTPKTLDPVNTIPITSNSTTMAPNVLSLSPPLLTSISSSSLPVFSSQVMPINASDTPPPFTSTIASNWTGGVGLPPLSEITFGGMPINNTIRPPFIPNSTGTFETLPLPQTSPGGILDNFTGYGSNSSPSLPFSVPNATAIPGHSIYQSTMKPPEVNRAEKHRNEPNSSEIIKDSYNTSSANNFRYSYLLLSFAAVFISFVLLVTIVRYSRMQQLTTPRFTSIV